MTNTTVKWAYKTLPKEGEIYSGDGFIVKETLNSVIISVIDGLGHGEDAYIATKTALNFLENFDFSKSFSLEYLFKALHGLLHGARGIVLGVAIIKKEEKKIGWLGVGNIAALVISNNLEMNYKTNYLINQAGIVGINLPPLIPYNVNLTGNELLIICTDGVEDFFGNKNEIIKYINSLSIDELSNELFDKYRIKSDDSLLWIGKIISED